jgi:hypothetical protein
MEPDFPSWNAGFISSAGRMCLACERYLQASVPMTYAEALRLPRSTRVRLLDGRVGYIIGWHHSTESVSLRYDGEGTFALRAATLRRSPDGSVEEAEPVGMVDDTSASAE